MLRDGFARTVAGAPAGFAEIAKGSARVHLAGLVPDRDLDRAVEHVMDGLQQAQPHADVAPGVRALSDLGIRLVTLGNGSAESADGVLRRAGVRDRVDLLLSVEDAPGWKPSGAAYRYAVDRCGVDPGSTMLVAVHPWDVDGADRAGLLTGWVNRGGAVYPGHFARPDTEVSGLDHLARVLSDS